MDTKILLVEDNQELSDLVCLHLKDQSWQVDPVMDAYTGYKKALDPLYSLIILDVMLPGQDPHTGMEMDGFEILKRIRAEKIFTPVLMLTSKSDEIDRVLGLEFGADDYVTKPFSIRELIARIKAIFRRCDLSAKSSSDDGEIFLCRSLNLDPEKRLVSLAGKSVELTAREFDLLHFLMKHPGRVFNRSQLLDQVWGYGHDGYEHTVNSNINRLRSKIETTPGEPEYILTVWGVGYKFLDEVSKIHHV